MIFASKHALAHMDTARDAIDFAASKLLPRAIAALLVLGSWSVQARVLSQTGDVSMQGLAVGLTNPCFCIKMQICVPVLIFPILSFAP